MAIHLQQFHADTSKSDNFLCTLFNPYWLLINDRKNEDLLKSAGIDQSTLIVLIRVCPKFNQVLCIKLKCPHSESFNYLIMESGYQNNRSIQVLKYESSTGPCKVSIRDKSSLTGLKQVILWMSIFILV